jgi:hypothetical protein
VLCEYGQNTLPTTQRQSEERMPNAVIAAKHPLHALFGRQFLHNLPLPSASLAVFLQTPQILIKASYGSFAEYFGDSDNSTRNSTPHLRCYAALR